MSKQRVRNKIYALIITVTLFMSVNNLSEAEEKSTVAGMELADNAGRISSREELDNDDRISDIKSRYTTEEVELGNELSSKKAKKIEEIQHVKQQKEKVKQIMYLKQIEKQNMI